MTNTASDQDLGRRIEQLVAEHIATIRKSAQEAMERAFASAPRHAATARSTPVAQRARTHNRRPPEQVAALGERLYQAVCGNPGVGMVVLAAELGATVRELHRPMTLLRRAGRVRSVGSRHLTRYFPMASKVAASS